MEEKKRCSKCKKNKLLKEFCKVKTGKFGRHHYCRKCMSEQKNARYRNDYEYRERRKAYNLMYKYNLTEDEFQLKLYMQNNKCAICNTKFKSKRQTLIDHNHITGKIRALLCPNCNNLLGACKDNIDILKSAIIYLQ